MKEESKVISCCICNHNKLFSVLDLGRTSLANNLVIKCSESICQKDYELGLIICQKCNHIQLNTEINPKILFSKYSYKTGISSTMIGHFEDFTRHLCKYFDKKKKSYSNIKVLDIGSNDSALLDILEEKGFKTFGVEPASNLANKSSHNILNDFFNDNSTQKIYNKFGNFDVITANNVFAHTRDLNNFVKNMSYLLKKDGLISIEVQYLPELIKNCYVDMIYHEHTSYHHLKPLCRLFNRNNLVLNSVTNISTHGGSMRIVLNKCSENKISFSEIEKSNDFIELDKDFDNKIHDKFNLLRAKILNIKTELNQIMKCLKEKYSIIYGYSAPAKTVTLLSLLDKDHIENIQFIIEDNKLKQGHYIPKTEIPLISTNEAIVKIENKKSACIIFAWNMFEELSKKIMSNPELNPDVLICPLPFPKILELNYEKK